MLKDELDAAFHAVASGQDYPCLNSLALFPGVRRASSTPRNSGANEVSVRARSAELLAIVMKYPEFSNHLFCRSFSDACRL